LDKLFVFTKLFPPADGVELKRKKLRFIGSVLLEGTGDFDVKWFGVEVDSSGDLFKRRYERLDDESDNGD